MIDLHIHTTISDGTNTLKEIISKANELKLEVISITDHDTVEAHLPKNKHIINKFNGEVINGVEMSTYFEGRIIHILVYDYDVNIMNNFLNSIPEENKYTYLKEINATLKTLDKLGLKYDKPNLEIKDPIKRKRHQLYSFLNNPKHFKYFGNKQIMTGEFFWKYLTNKDSMFFTDFSKFTVNIDDLIKVAHKAGGKCFLAHAYLYGFNMPGHLNLLTQKGIDGIECYYPTYSKEQINYLVTYCIKNNLYKSVGSDFHGTDRANKLGTGLNNNLCKTKDVIKDWYKQW